MRQPSDKAVDNWRRRSRWIVDACLDRAEARLASRKYEHAARWLQLAARVAEAGSSGYFAHPRLETAALALARTLPDPEGQIREDGPRRWLHVLTVALATGGHTAMLRRWMNNDRSEASNSVVLTTDMPVPAMLTEIVERGGGGVMVLPGTGVLERAAALRAAARNADVVVLHHHMWDIVPAIAFGVPGGPPVLALNHADHTFWVGAAVTDLAVNLRPVGAELNRRYRSIDRNTELAIPLDAPPEPAERAAAREKMRTSLGIPNGAIVFLTVGSGFKYLPVGELDFPLTARRLLERLPDAYLIAVGPVARRPEWRGHVRAVSPRMIAVGLKRGVDAYLAAADIYLEGFPFNSATALLEASLAGLPVVPVPATAPLPFSAHEGLKAVLPQPLDVPGYLDDAVRLARSPSLRRERAESMNKAVAAACGGEGWRHGLALLVDAVPAEHRVHAVADRPLDERLDRFLARLSISRRRLLRLTARLVQEALVARR